MKEIFLTDDIKDKMRSKTIDGFNSESLIYFYNRYIIKWFNESVNKLEKKELLLRFDGVRKQIQINLPEIVLPQALVYYDDLFAGYQMEFIYGKSLNNILEDESLSFEFKRNVLIELGKFLERMDNVRKNVLPLRNLFINDLHGDNVMVMPDGQIKLLEVDSMKFNNSYNFAAYYLNQLYYSKMYKLRDKYDQGLESILANRESDLYCYIMIVLNFICGKSMHYLRYENYEFYLKEMVSLGLPKELYETFMGVYSDTVNENPYKLLYKLDGRIIL